jgi:hypothetical protein
VLAQESNKEPEAPAQNRKIEPFSLANRIKLVFSIPAAVMGIAGARQGGFSSEQVMSR